MVWPEADEARKAPVTQAAQAVRQATGARTFLSVVVVHGLENPCPVFLPSHM